MLVLTAKRIKMLQRLSDIDSQRSSEALDTLNIIQPSGRRLQRYKALLYDVLCNSGPQFVLLCAIALGQAKASDMRNNDRVSLVSNIKTNINNIHVNHSIIRSLATKYHISDSVISTSSFLYNRVLKERNWFRADLLPLLYITTERPRKRKQTSINSQYPKAVSSTNKLN